MNNQEIVCNGASIKPVLQSINTADGTPLNLKHLEISKNHRICLSNDGRLYRGKNEQNTPLNSIQSSQSYTTYVQTMFNTDGTIIAAREPFGAIQFFYGKKDEKEHIVRTEPLHFPCDELYCNSLLETYDYVYTPGNNICYMFPIPSTNEKETTTTGDSSYFHNFENISVIHYYNNILTLYACGGANSSRIIFYKKISTGCEDMGAIGFPEEVNKIPLAVWHPSSLYCAFAVNNKVGLSNLQDTFNSKKAPLIINDSLVQDDTIQELFFASAKTIVIVGQKNIYFYYIDEDKLKSYPLPAYQYAKWHRLVQQLSLSNGNQALLYQFPHYN